MAQLVVSTSARVRWSAARRFLSGFPSATEVLVVGATRGAADDFVRDLARGRATFGLSRFSLTALAARAAAAGVAASGHAPAGDAAAEATAARAAFEADAAGELTYFMPVARMPGFSRALARTLHELRLGGESIGALATRGRAAADLGRLLARVEAALASAGAVDRAALFDLAAEAWRAGTVRWAGLPVVLLDVPLDSQAERRFATAVCARAPAVLATSPADDAGPHRLITELGGTIDIVPDDAAGGSDLAHLRRDIFVPEPPAVRERAGDVRLFSAPGEGREAIEIARRVLDEAARGVPFDDMAVLLRSRDHYLGLLEHAFDRAGVPAYFDRGTRRPDPAGRAFVAIISCACEGLSAKRFDEYLSLGQVPRLAAAGPPAVVAPLDEVFMESRVDEPEPGEEPDEPPRDGAEDAIVAGTLRSPWKWEELIVESSVVAGKDRAEGKHRWRRRLDGLAADYRLRLDEIRREEPESPRIGRYERDLRNLRHLRAFALPIIDRLADWPEDATWSEWLRHFEAIAPLVLARPARVLRTLADLRPMAGVGPVRLEEARDVLHDRLVTLDWDPPARRYGRVFVGSPHQARGRVFRVVFVPGVAERMFPQRLREDPLLLDQVRRQLAAPLVTQTERTAAERLLLRISIGAATERLYLSYPRLDVAETRPRVPSFYALDVMRAITGRVPDHRSLAADAADEAGVNLSWPAPVDPDRAIDDLEHDLAVLKPLLDVRDASAVKGHAHYLLDLNDALKRSVISRWARGKTRWSTSDGLIRVTPGTAAALASQRLGARPYSLSALQRFAACPYQFLLASVYRLEPWEQPEPVLRLDPLTRGSLFHRAQAEFYRTLQAEGALPVTPSTVRDAAATLNAVLDRVAAAYADELAPAIDRVWQDEINDVRRDLGIWVRRLAEERTWIPEYFEFSFGLGAGGPREESESSSGAARASGGGAPRAFEVDEGRDPRSVADPVRVDDRFLLRGSVDLVERHQELDLLRVTDHKTGKNRSRPDLIVGGGSVLQPVLYSAAVEQALGRKVIEGRLFYCTTVGGFGVHPIQIDDYTRGQGLQVLAIVDRAIELGVVPAAPAPDACRWCDFRPVCGPREEERVARKSGAMLADVTALREMR